MQNLAGFVVMSAWIPEGAGEHARRMTKPKYLCLVRKCFPKSCLKGGGGRGKKGSFVESSLWNTWRRTPNELEGRKEEEEVEALVGVGGDNHFYIVIQCMEEGWRVRIIAPVPPQYFESTLIDKATCWRGPSCWQDLRRLFTEELVWSGAPIALLYGKDLSFDVSLFLQFPSHSCFLPKQMLSLIVCLTHIHPNLRRHCGGKTTETVSNRCTVPI